MDERAIIFKDCKCVSNQRSANDFLAAASCFKITLFVSVIKLRFLRAPEYAVPVQFWLASLYRTTLRTASHTYRTIWNPELEE